MKQNRKDLKSHPTELDYDDVADISAPYPMSSAKGDLIEYKTEQQFNSFLKLRAASEPETLEVIPVSYSYDSPLDIAPTMKAMLAAPPATVEDALDFVVDIQDKQEAEFLASGSDTTPLRSMRPNQFEDYLLMQYSNDYYHMDETLNSLLSAQGLGSNMSPIEPWGTQAPTFDHFDPNKVITPQPQVYLPGG